MRIAKGLLLLGMAALLAASLRAQQHNASHSEIDLALTYTAQHGSVKGGGGFWRRAAVSTFLPLPTTASV